MRPADSNPTFQAGDLMLITDHLGLAAMAGQNPLAGPNDESLVPRFVDMARLMTRSCGAGAASRRPSGLTLRQGIYAGVFGPTFETPAEVRFLRLAPDAWACRRSPR